MSLPYAFVKVLAREGDPNIRQFPRGVDDPFKQAEYLMQDGNMRGRYLGQCLDSCRWGSTHTILYEMNALQMTEFIKNWMRQNKSDMQFHEVELSSDFELPYIEHEKCPRNSNHKLKVRGLDGTIRCVDEDAREIREPLLISDIYYDNLSQSRRRVHVPPFLPQINRLRHKDDTKITVRERCGAILSDRGVTLPLAEIISRLNVFEGSRIFCKGEYCKDPFLKEMDIERECFGHIVKDHLEFPFDGWYLSWCVQKWYEQPPEGTAPFTTPKVTERLMKEIKPV